MSACSVVDHSGSGVATPARSISSASSPSARSAAAALADVSSSSSASPFHLVFPSLPSALKTPLEALRHLQSSANLNLPFPHFPQLPQFPPLPSHSLNSFNPLNSLASLNLTGLNLNLNTLGSLQSLPSLMQSNFTLPFKLTMPNMPNLPSLPSLSSLPSLPFSLAPGTGPGHHSSNSSVTDGENGDISSVASPSLRSISDWSDIAGSVSDCPLDQMRPIVARAIALPDPIPARAINNPPRHAALKRKSSGGKVAVATPATVITRSDDESEDSDSDTARSQSKKRRLSSASKPNSRRRPPQVFIKPQLVSDYQKAPIRIYQILIPLALRTRADDERSDSFNPTGIQLPHIAAQLRFMGPRRDQVKYNSNSSPAAEAKEQSQPASRSHSPSQSSAVPQPFNHGIHVVATDVCRLINIRKSNAAKTVAQFGDSEKLSMPILCSTQRGTTSVHVLTVLSRTGVRRLLTTSCSPIASPLLEWLEKQFDQLDYAIQSGEIRTDDSDIPPVPSHATRIEFLPDQDHRNAIRFVPSETYPTVKSKRSNRPSSSQSQSRSPYPHISGSASQSASVADDSVYENETE